MIVLHPYSYVLSRIFCVPLYKWVRTSFYAVSDGVGPDGDLKDETCARQVPNYYVEMINCMITFLVNF